MTFRYQPDRFAPDPWPVDGPADLSDREYQAALDSIDSPYISNILAALHNTGSSNVIAWLLMLSRGYQGDEGKEYQGYIIRAVVRDRRALRRELERLGGLTGAARGEAGQLALSLRMIPPNPRETRDRVVGWGFADQ